MAKRKALGKGLKALFPDALIEDETREDGVGRIEMLPVENLVPNKFQPRRDFDEGKLKELADSIKEHGVIQPIVVRALEGGKYEIVAGERRWRACKMLGIEKIPAVVKEYSNRQLTEVALIENVQREDLNPLEEAHAYDILIKEFSFTQEDLAKRIGKSRSFIANMLRLLQLEEDVQKMVEEGKLSAGHARALLGVKGKEQVRLAEKVIKDGLSVRQTENLVKQITAEKKEGTEKRKREENLKKEEKSVYIEELEERLAEVLGTRVKIQGKDKGRIIIEYYSLEELERLLEYIVG
ncbi:MAG TPA: chromosome partitioning protein ParB [Peptococcaceae bacterium]|nr:MAG: ParB-like partition protein [Clostridia bacterium 41_269]HBT19801.1 chromosome partitioning protein ParB [Peptococcaceae bacterium]